MNANEAISKIRFMLDVGGSDGFTSADKEALNMAINVLSAEITAPPKSNGDRIRQMTDEELAAEAWNRRNDDDTAEWIDKEVRGSITNVCSKCGSCSVYPDKYCGGCGRSMKNGY